jgi:hypothetical protein
MNADSTFDLLSHFPRITRIKRKNKDFRKSVFIRVIRGE